MKLYAESLDRLIAQGFVLASDREEMLKIAAALYDAASGSYASCDGTAVIKDFKFDCFSILVFVPLIAVVCFSGTDSLGLPSDLGERANLSLN